jgi:Flp pilus assembly pilin Flp
MPPGVHQQPRKGEIICSQILAGGTAVKRINSFLSDENGAELAEYAVGVAIVVAIAIIVYQVLGDAINAKMISVTNEIDAPPPAAPPAPAAP